MLTRGDARFIIERLVIHEAINLAFRHEIFLTDRRRLEMRQQGWWSDETILDYFDEAVRQRPNHVAVVDFKSPEGSRRALTYAELGRHVAHIAANLKRLGVGRGDVVSIQLPNWWETAVVYQYKLRGKNGILRNTTALNGGQGGGFWIQGNRIIAGDGADVGIWDYPAGGSPVQTIPGGFYGPVNAAVSLPK